MIVVVPVPVLVIVAVIVVGHDQSYFHCWLYVFHQSFPHSLHRISPVYHQLRRLMMTMMVK